MADDFNDPSSNERDRGDNESTQNGGTPRGSKILSFSERQTKLRHAEGNTEQKRSPNSSNKYQSSPQPDTELGKNSGSPGDSHEPRGQRMTDPRNSPHAEPPNPPNLGSRPSGLPFGVNSVSGHREVIKLSIEFPLRNGNSGNDIALFFKRFITVLFAANKKILLTKWIPGDENPISKAIDIAYNEDTISE